MPGQSRLDQVPLQRDAGGLGPTFKGGVFVVTQPDYDLSGSSPGDVAESSSADAGCDSGTDLTAGRADGGIWLTGHRLRLFAQRSEPETISGTGPWREPAARPPRPVILDVYLAPAVMNPKSECHERFMVRAKGNRRVSPMGSLQCLSFRPWGRRCDDTTVA